MAGALASELEAVGAEPGGGAEVGGGAPTDCLLASPLEDFPLLEPRHTNITIAIPRTKNTITIIIQSQVEPSFEPLSFGLE